MAKNKKFSPSQLRWLAESLTNTQMAYLLESEDDLQNANKNAGVVEEPKNPGMQTTDSKGSMQPTVQTAKEPQDDKAQVATVCKAVKAGKLSKIEPNQMVKFLQNAGISMNNVGIALKHAIEYLHTEITSNKMVDKTIFQNVFAGCSNLMGAMLNYKNSVAESVMSDAQKKGVNVKLLAENIKSNNVYTVFNEGKKLNYDEKLNLGLKRFKMMNESLHKEFGNDIPRESLNQMRQMQKSLEESIKVNGFEHRINEYYDIVIALKNLEKLCEARDIKFVEYSNARKVTKSVDNKINENMSALKFALNYYKKSK